MFGGDPTARRAELVDPVEQQVLRVRRQVDQQTFCGPCRRLAGVESVVQQCLRPVFTKIDGDRASLRRRRGTQVRQRLGLEVDHLGLVDLEYGRSVGPRQSIGPSVQARRQNHGLTDAVGRGVGEQPVEMPCAHRPALGRPLKAEPWVDVVEGDLSVERTNEEVESDGTHQGLGERIVDQPLTIGQHTLCGDQVAVAPTLDARSQESSSVRAIMLLEVSPSGTRNLPSF